MRALYTTAVAFLAVFAIFLSGCQRESAGRIADAQENTSKPEKIGDYTVSGPYTHENLTVYLFHGPDRLPGKTYLTLQEALEKKTLIVHETSNVNQLAVENVGSDDVYIQSGDIVKGGRQDRTFSFDYIAQAKSGRTPIDSYCVEHGRWRQRGGEAVANFDSSNNYVSSKALKQSGGRGLSQQEVWDNVEKSTTRVSSNVGRNINSTTSPSSYQLALESKLVTESTDNYVRKVSPAVEGKSDVVGYAFAINGEVNSAEIYANSALFRKLWPKLINASAVEAIAELKKDAKYAPVSVDAVRKTLADASSGKQTTRDVGARVQYQTVAGKEADLYECRDKAASGEWIHRSYLKR